MRLKDQYQKQIIPAMMEKFGYKSRMAVPRLEKVVVNCGFGKEVAGKGAGERIKYEQHILEYLKLITGQKPATRKAKKSIASFKLREGVVIGAQTTLRGKRMYEFLEKLLNLVLPRTRDFRGIALKSVPKTGDLTIGLKEFTPFPEVKVEREKGLFGLEITIKINSGTRKEKIELLRLLGVPLQR